MVERLYAVSYINIEQSHSGKVNKSLRVEGILSLMSCGVEKSLYGVRLGIWNIILL
jgi:hypothetical protein